MFITAAKELNKEKSSNCSIHNFIFEVIFLNVKYIYCQCHVEWSNERRNRSQLLHNHEKTTFDKVGLVVLPVFQLSWAQHFTLELHTLTAWRIYEGQQSPFSIFILFYSILYLLMHRLILWPMIWKCQFLTWWNTALSLNSFGKLAGWLLRIDLDMVHLL